VIVPDVNVLIYAFREEQPDHGRGLIAWTDSNAALLDLMDEADGVYDRYRGNTPEAS